MFEFVDKQHDAGAGSLLRGDAYPAATLRTTAREGHEGDRPQHMLVREHVPDAVIDVGPGHIATLDRQGEYNISAA